MKRHLEGERVLRDKPQELDFIVQARATCQVPICNGGGHMVIVIVKEQHILAAT